jgi:hypothetical protein
MNLLSIIILWSQVMIGKSSVLARTIAVFLISGLIWITAAVIPPVALALTQIPLSNVSYHECPPEIAEGTVTSGGTLRAASCFIVTGTTKNTSGKTVYDADIFGRIYDANGDSVMQNRTRLGAIEKILPGEGQFELRISVAANQPTPLKLEQFKAAGFTGKVRQ